MAGRGLGPVDLVARGADVAPLPLSSLLTVRVLPVRERRHLAIYEDERAHG